MQAPPPGYCHPDLERLAGILTRDGVLAPTSTEHTVFFCEPEEVPTVAMASDETSPSVTHIPKHTLTIHKAVVSNPELSQVWMWKFGVDDLGRMIAGWEWRVR